MEDLRIAAWEYLSLLWTAIDQSGKDDCSDDAWDAYCKSRSRLIEISHAMPAASLLLATINDLDSATLQFQRLQSLVEHEAVPENLADVRHNEALDSLTPVTRKLSLITGVMSGKAYAETEFTEPRPPAEWVLIFCRRDGSCPTIEWFRLERRDGRIVSKPDTTKKVQVATECLPGWAKTEFQRNQIVMLKSDTERASFTEAQTKPK